MIRRLMTASKPEQVNGFRMRGKEVTRLECFSDCVFGFALTLLIVALEVPKTFGDLLVTMRGFVAFGICFALFVTIWNRHYIYCRRYGMEDRVVRFLTCALLFVVLLYVYPLKFLFKLVVDSLIFGDASSSKEAHMQSPQFAQLFMIYGAGLIAVTAVFFFLYLHAYRNRVNLELNELETHDTKWSMIEQLLMICVPLISILIAVFAPTQYVGFAGWAYTLGGFVGWTVGSMHGGGRRKLAEALSTKA